MKAYRHPPENETQRWWRNLLLRAAKVTADQDFLDEDRHKLLDVVEPNCLPDLREAAQALIRLADGLEKLVRESEKEAFETAA